MKMLITGSSGMLGRKLSLVARERGGNVLGVDLRGGDVEADLTDDEALLSVLKQERPDVVVNTAAMIDVGLCEEHPLAAWRLNARSVGVMAQFCRDHGCKLLQISTEHYFAGDGAARHDEQAPVTFFNEYARSKYAGEAFAAIAPSALIVRTNIVGFRGVGRPTFAEWVCKAIVSDAEMTLFEDSYVSSIDVTTFSRALLDLMEKNASGLFNLASSEVFSKRDFILAMARHLGVRLTRAKTGSVSSLPVKRPDSCGLDVGRAVKLLGYKLPGLDEVTRHLAEEWEKHEGKS